MINLFCDKCVNVPDAQLNLRTEDNSIIIECLVCGAMKRFKPNGTGVGK